MDDMNDEAKEAIDEAFPSARLASQAAAEKLLVEVG